MLSKGIGKSSLHSPGLKPSAKKSLDVRALNRFKGSDRQLRSVISHLPLHEQQRSLDGARPNVSSHLKKQISAEYRPILNATADETASASKIERERFRSLNNEDVFKHTRINTSSATAVGNT